MAYQFGGGDNSPYFINLKPFKLDFTPVKETEELKAKLRLAAEKRAQELQDQVKELEMPKFDKAISTDTIMPYERALAARQGMLERLNASPNKFWTYSNDPEFRQYQQEYQQWTSPDVNLRLAKEYDALKGFTGRMKDKEGSSNALVLGPDGEFVFGSGPEHDGGPGVPLTAGALSLLREYNPRYSFYGGNPPTDLEGVVLATPAEEGARIDDIVKGIGISGSEGDDPRPMDGGELARIITRRTGWESNAGQIADASRALFDRPFSPEEKLSVIQGYMNTAGFANKYKKAMEGDYSTFQDEWLNDQGRLSADKVFQHALNSTDYAEVVQKKGRKTEKVGLSYYQEQVFTRLKRFAKDKTTSSVNYIGAPKSETTKDDKVQPWQVIASGEPHEVYEKGEKAVPVYAPSGDMQEGKGKVIGLTGKVYASNMMPGLMANTMKEMGVYDKNNELKPGMKLSRFYGSRPIYFELDGQEVPSEWKKHMTIVSVDESASYLYPATFGEGLDSPENASKGLVSWKYPENYKKGDLMVPFRKEGDTDINYGKPGYIIEVKLDDDRPQINGSVWVPEDAELPSDRPPVTYKESMYPEYNKAGLNPYASPRQAGRDNASAVTALPEERKEPRAGMRRVSINDLDVEGFSNANSFDWGTKEKTIKIFVPVSTAEQRLNLWVDRKLFDDWIDQRRSRPGNVDSGGDNTRNNISEQVKNRQR